MLSDLLIATVCIKSNNKSRRVLTTCRMYQHILELIDNVFCNRAEARKVIPMSPVSYVKLPANKLEFY
jgi:hypothetical protein